MFISRGERYLCATRRILLFVRRRIISAEAETRHICWTMTFPVLRKCVCASGCRYNCPKENSEKAIQMLCRDLPAAVDMFIAQFDIVKFNQTIALSTKQADIRAWLEKSDDCAFIANGSVLPRAKATDLPLTGATPFCSTPNDEIEVCGVRGMAIRRGVTVITGGGYSGKSTLLDAISAGIYDHCLGDGASCASPTLQP